MAVIYVCDRCRQQDSLCLRTIEIPATNVRHVNTGKYGLKRALCWRCIGALVAWMDAFSPDAAPERTEG